MGNPRGFLEIPRIESGYRPVEERISDYSEVEKLLPEEDRRLQASRCMDCGVPFCHWACPVSNIMPEWHDMIYRGRWKDAYAILSETNNFPEFTGRVCPAPCEASCVLSINDAPVTIRQNELAVAEKAFSEGFIKAHPPKKRTGKKVAVIGSGPAGLACADVLNKKGHSVVLFESADSVGGYLRFGIPDFKLDKRIIDRRVNILIGEGIEIRTGIEVGKDIDAVSIRKEFDAICIAIGAREARDLNIEGRELDGIYLAMSYLEQQNRIVRGEEIPQSCIINAYNKNVVVIGGGDTGADCVGSANRQGARRVTQVEILPMPPIKRPEHEPWPLWPKVLKTSSSHEEGCERLWNIKTKRFCGIDGKVSSIECVRVSWQRDERGMLIPVEIANSDFEIKAEMVILALGFLHVKHTGLVEQFGLALNPAGNIAINERMMTSEEGIFAAGDATRGASLVVWAIHEGRSVATHIDDYLSS
ncbi:MAG: glutamate synthase subunit beta [Spirochaetes bacterium]|nr:glutamate synthase subunit beta [Spirochaetota bacterium]